MTRRHIWLTGGGLAVLVLIALFVAGTRAVPIRSLALGAPDESWVVGLHPRQYVCEGPLTSASAVGGARIWGAAIGAPARLTVRILDSGTGTLLTSGELSVAADHSSPVLASAHTAWLRRLAPAGRPLRICLDESLNTFTLAGSPAVRRDVTMTGKPGGREFSLVLLAGSTSLIASLPTAFARAALFRPSWVGSWTFWVLAVALVGTFWLATMAVAGAASADDADDRPDGDDSPPGGLPGPPEPTPAAGSRSAA